MACLQKKKKKITLILFKKRFFLFTKKKYEFIGSITIDNKIVIEIVYGINRKIFKMFILCKSKS